MRFSKMQGVGNDFVVLDAALLPERTDWAALATALCARRVGVGADGLLVVSRLAPPELGAGGASFAMRMFNPDGTEDMCGNGLRCVALWAHRAGWLGGRTEFRVATKDGLRDVRLLQSGPDCRSGVFAVDMGIPRFAPTDIPFLGAGGSSVVGVPLTVDGETVHITAVNTGSTHTVLFGAVPPDEGTFQRLSPLIERHPQFPERTSVLWATPQGGNVIAVRIWERGVGETLGCGTGACAVAVAARCYDNLAVFGGLDDHRPIDVVSQGGTLHITWPGPGAPIQMVGPAEFVFDGDIALAAPPQTHL